MSKPLKIFLKSLAVLFGVIVLLLGAYTLWAYISWSNQSEFNVEGRLGNIDVPADTLHIMCSKGEGDIKDPAPIEQLNTFLSQIIESCGDNANAILLYGSDGKGYDILIRSNSKFAPGKIIVLKQDVIPSDESTKTELTVYDASSYEQVYQKDLGVIPSFIREGEWGVVFKDFDEDGKTEARVRTEFPAETGYLTLHYVDGKFSSWKSPARNMHYGFVFRDDVLYCGDIPRPDINLSSFVIFNSTWAKDSRYVYKYDCAPHDVQYDVASFTAIDEEGNFVKDKNGVYFDGYLGGLGLSGSNKIEGADPETYVYFSGGLGKDKNQVFSWIYPDEGYKGVDVATLVGVEDPERGGLWMKDKNQVYWRGNIVEGANPATFMVMSSEYGRDGDKLYYTYKYIPTGDPDTLKNIVDDIGAYQKDKNNIYYIEGPFDEGPIIATADHATFRPINSYYAKDKVHVYYGNRIIEGADPETFVDLGEYGYSKDKNHVYLSGNIVEGKDPSTFSPENQ